MENLSNEGLDLLFREARTHNAWLDRPVEDDRLRALYDLVKWGPTAANASPARFVFLRSRQAKERLRPSLSPGNADKTMAAPVTVIVAYDLLFFEKLPSSSRTTRGCRRCTRPIPSSWRRRRGATRRCRAPT